MPVILVNKVVDEKRIIGERGLRRRSTRGLLTLLPTKKLFQDHLMLWWGSNPRT
jgi:hypothetical protein